MNLNQRQIDLIKHLELFPEWHTGKNLARLFDISIRTIRTDIAHINLEYKQVAIISSKHYGYRLNPSFSTSCLESTRLNLLYEHRHIYMLIELLTKPYITIDYYDFADSFYISEPTLNQDLYTIKSILQEFPYYSVEIEKHGSTVFVKGSLVDCGKLLHSYIKSKGYYCYFSDFEPCFKSISISEVKRIIKQHFTFQDYTRYLTFEDVFIFSCIFLEQAHNCSSFPIPYNQQLDSFPFKQNILNFIAHLSSLYEKTVFATFKQSFLSVLVPLIEIEIEEYAIKSENEMETDPLFPVLLEVLSEVKESFSLDIASHNKLVQSFYTHIKIAFLRMDKHIYTSNPLLEHIRLNYAFLFDVAYFIANQLSKKMMRFLSRDEVSFFVVYLINPLKEIKDDLLKNYEVNILLYSIEGPAIAHNIKEYLTSKIVNQHISFTMILSISEMNDFPIKNYDLLVTTDSSIRVTSIESIVIHPFITSLDLSKLKSMIEQIYETKKKLHFNQLYNYFFQDRFINLGTSFTSSEDAILSICNELIAINYVPSDYSSQVMERENLLSTSFDSGIALPHATHNSAYKSMIHVSLLHHPLDWGGKKVRAILLVAIAREDLNLLNQIYRVLITLSSSDSEIQRLRKVKSTYEFKQLLETIYYQSE